MSQWKDTEESVLPFVCVGTLRAGPEVRGSARDYTHQSLDLDLVRDPATMNGHIKRVTDNDMHSMALEVMGANVSTTYVTCPADPKKTLGIKHPILVMIVKNLKKNFSFEVQVLDDKGFQRRFRASNYRKTTRVNPFICTMPMTLNDGWNQIQFNLSDFTRKAYETNYSETQRVQIHANCRIRRVYFSDKLYAEDEIPTEFKLYLPVQNQKAKKQLQQQHQQQQQQEQEQKQQEPQN